MKRLICALLAICVLSCFLGSTVSAHETEEYSVEITLITRESDLPDIPYTAYFRNIATGEMVGFLLNPVGYNSFPVENLTPGEYELVGLVPSTNKNVEYSATGEVNVLQVLEDDYTFYTIKVSATGTELSENSAYSSATVYRPKVDNSKNSENNPLFWVTLVGIFIPVLLSLFLWIINAILSRRNFYRYFVAKLYKHLTIAIFSFMLASAWASDSSLPPLLVILFCTGFPFGIIAVSTFSACYDFLPTAEEMDERAAMRDFRSSDENAMIDSAMGCGALLLGLLCGIVGVIALPVVLIKDIKNIKQFKYLNRKIR